jgi:hypothetical protein
MRVVALLLGSVVLASSAVASSGKKVVAANGVRVSVPAGWTRVRAASSGQITDPVTLLVVGTRGVRARRSGCQIATYRVQPSRAVVVIVGWKNLTLSGTRPQDSGRRMLAALTTVHRPSFECFSGRGAVATLRLNGKAYQVNVLVGDRAPPQRVREALAVARSFDLAH